MKGINFPIEGTKTKGVSNIFDLNDPKDRIKYFHAKAGREIKDIKRFLTKGTFMANMLGKKGAGKGTYSKMLGEIFGTEKMVHIAVGDLVRDAHANWEEFSKGSDIAKLKGYYRGFISFDEAIERLHGRSQDKLLPTEFILALLKYNVAKHSGKTIFIDGIPRDSDQISYSLFFRDLFNFRDDPDLFILIDIPEVVIEERIKTRVVCPECKTSRNLRLLPTSKIGYDVNLNLYYLNCDNPDCSGPRMVTKEGDEMGIAPIRKRLDKDEEVMKTVLGMHGVPKVLLRNAVPVAEAEAKFDDYELTRSYTYELNSKTKKVKVKEDLWKFPDDNGVESYSLLAPAVVVSLLKQLPEALGI